VLPDWTPLRQSSADTLNAMVADCSSDPKAALDKLARTFADELTKQGAKA
jgi:multiple sugar transport system substrate-binding protein